MATLRRRQVLLAIGAGFAASVWAQRTFPAQPIRIIVPFGAGGPPDIYSRQLAKELSARVGQPVIVENRPGANGTLGSGYVARGVPADGYTLLYGTNSGLSAARSMTKSLAYDPTGDFAGVSMIGDASFLLVAPASDLQATIKDFTDRARTRPGALNLGGASLTTQLAARLMTNAAGLDVVYVPYKENTRMLVELMGGQLDAGISPVRAAKPLIEQGKLVALAVTGPQRLQGMPNVPLLSELWPGVAVTAWSGYFVPANTPREVVDVLNQHISGVTSGSQELRSQVLEQGRPIEMAPREIDQFVRKDEARWTALFKSAGIGPE